MYKQYFTKSVGGFVQILQILPLGYKYVTHKELLMEITRKTSRFPYIGSWCVLFPVLTQHVMAAVCFQTVFSNYVIKLAFIVLFIITFTSELPS